MECLFLWLFLDKISRNFRSSLLISYLFLPFNSKAWKHFLLMLRPLKLHNLIQQNSFSKHCKFKKPLVDKGLCKYKMSRKKPKQSLNFTGFYNYVSLIWFIWRLAMLSQKCWLWIVDTNIFGYFMALLYSLFRHYLRRFIRWWIVTLYGRLKC